MENIIKSTALSATRMLLRQVASVLLKCGVTWKEFSDLSKWIFVDVATNEFGIKGRDTNISRVSILTGISRKEAKRQRELTNDSDDSLSSKTTDATRLLSAWHHDQDFLDSKGRPLPLKLNGSVPSFKELHDRYGGDIPLQAMLKELINTDSVEMDMKSQDQTLTVLRSYFVPRSMDIEMLLHFGRTLRDHASTLNVNVTNKGEREPRFEGYAAIEDVDKKYEKEFKEYIDRKGQIFLDEVDEWLTERRATSSNPATKTVRLGVGAYAIHGVTNEEKKP